MMRDRCMNRHNTPASRTGRKNQFSMLHHTYFPLLSHTHTHTLIFADNNLTTIRYKESESTNVLKNTTTKQKSKEISFVSFAIKLQKQARSDHDHIIIFVQMLKVASSLTFRKQNINKIK